MTTKQWAELFAQTARDAGYDVHVVDEDDEPRGGCDCSLCLGM